MAGHYPVSSAYLLHGIPEVSLKEKLLYSSHTSLTPLSALPGLLSSPLFCSGQLRVDKQVH